MVLEGGKVRTYVYCGCLERHPINPRKCQASMQPNWVSLYGIVLGASNVRSPFIVVFANYHLRFDQISHDVYDI